MVNNNLPSTIIKFRVIIGQLAAAGRRRPRYACVASVRYQAGA